MPHHFEFDSEHKILLTVLEGEIQGPELLAIDDDMLKRIERMHPAAGICDLTGVTNLNVQAAVLRTAALQPEPYPSEALRFIVAPTDVLYGMARMYELVGNRPNGQMHVVRSRQEALSALSASNAEFGPID